MSSSQFFILCIILISSFPLHECENGKSVEASNAAKTLCMSVNCDNKDRNLTCACCLAKSKNRCYSSKSECVADCKD
ncbi:unnamed protein product [Arabidopsis thaliana]|uniref:EMBRYO SURROUNDING FACTOR 1-like protein 8 n=3 Tax=Arabidopsis TaxID=3701 RepID=ESFL8_ARATH|nr:maternally expressed family protein [Arabidopsis thaliana]A8MR88.1 RecName: Full=EMBRYO SURROUNDING FACTOR 1-like protein 8; Flags: Precursor [Arabidopsis thaliana]KAG7640974.1 hypothetical protein ISN44_As02g010250 [Arabidopsis suecica]AEC06509.1 maternally expressed family protein [Arabidopsis thaliana]CAA0363142.1 unnamed protein product [Arabidopsis thaliana]VYS52541.1 unnamed protein product [Arabidopsis thaliana]|eukprot:NP_001077898.1 maternally expressed family protein [Arabidopsis thaliana]